jgi:adenylate cyclase
MVPTVSGKARPWVAGALAGLTVGLVGFVLATWRPDALERGELWTYDLRLRNGASGRQAATDIVLIDVSELDIESVENNLSISWPWPRALFGYIATYCKRAGARVVVFDWLFQDRGQFSVSDAEELATALREAGNGVIGLALTKEPLTRDAPRGPWAMKVATLSGRAEAVQLALALQAWNARTFLLGAGADAAKKGGGPVELWLGGMASEAEVQAMWSRLARPETAGDLLISEDEGEAGSETGSGSGTGSGTETGSGSETGTGTGTETGSGSEPGSGSGSEPGSGSGTGSGMETGSGSEPGSGSGTETGSGSETGTGTETESGSDPSAPAVPPTRALSPAELASELRIADLIVERDGQAGPGAVPVRDGIDPPLGVLATASARLGHVHQTNDVDGVMRRHAPLVRHAGVLFPSLPLAAYLVAHPEVRYRVEDGDLVVGAKRLPLDDTGRTSIRFVSAGSYRSLSSYEILRSQALLDEGKPPSIPDSALRGAYVIVAATAHGLRDLRTTPMAEEQLGAEINANVLDNLERGISIRRVPGALDGLATLLLCVATALVMTWLSRRIIRPLIALPLMLFVAAALIGGHLLLAAWLLDARDLWIAVAVPAASCAAAAFVTMVGLSVAERAGRRFVQEALGRYTSPELVRELIAHPEHLSLDWGQEREMSVYFSDIAGFTTISEHLTARQLVSLLNEYLTEMTDLVLAHGGVVDKYIGDAVMAFWGAPLPAADHAVRGVTCAIAMRKRCDELRGSWQSRYGHEIHARAGVNSGHAVVGNMGSKHKYNYTLMGDMVNLAARLEGANKPYGTYLMISEFTLALLGGAVEVRELDLVAVKGKNLPVKVYEVIDLVGQASAAALAVARRFQEALALYRAQEFSEAEQIFAELVKDHADPPSKLYVERCQRFAAEPPPAEWNGVWHMKEK